MLIVVSGLPGTGKSTIADALGRRFSAPVLSVDPIEAAIWRSGVAPSFETGLAAYEVAATLAEHQLRLGMSAIVDAVSSIEAAREMWRRAATRAGTTICVIEVTCSDESVLRIRVETRQRDIEGFYEPTWEAVQNRRLEYEPWSEARLTLDTSGHGSESVAEAIDYVEQRLRAAGEEAPT